MKNTIIACFIAAFISSCSDGSLPKTEVINRKITGSVRLFDDMDNAQDASGMTVTIEGTSYVSVTDTAGKYAFLTVPYGTYTIRFEKSGYGTYRLINLAHDNDMNATPQQIPAINLGALSRVSVTGMYAKLKTDTVRISATIDPYGTVDSARGIRYFFGRSASVSPTDYVFYSNVDKVKDSTSDYFVTAATCKDNGFAAGDTVYVKAFGDSYFSNDYTEPETQKTIFPDINSNAADAVYFVLP